MSLTIFSKYLYWTIELVQGKGQPAAVNYYSEIEDRDDEDGMTICDEECEVRASDGGGPNQTADESQSYVNEDEDPSLNVHWPLTKNPAYGLPPVGILQSDGKCEVRTSDGGGPNQTADKSQSYVNEDEDPSLNVHWPLTKNPAYGLPPVGILQSDGKCEVRTGDGGGSRQTTDESQSYVYEDEDPSLNVHCPLTKNPAYGLPPVGILQSDHVNDNGTQQ